MLTDNFYLETERLQIVPFDYQYLQNYAEEFTEEIARLQYPDPFSSIDAAKQVVDEFVNEMHQGRMLELLILSKSGEFLGNMEVFGLEETSPEVGLWLKQSCHRQGYGYEALSAMISFLNDLEKYNGYIYAVDERNMASLALVKRFECEQIGLDPIVTESGKQLKLLLYKIYR